MKGQSNGTGVDRHLRSHSHVHVRRVDGCGWGTDGADGRQEHDFAQCARLWRLSSLDDRGLLQIELNPDCAKSRLRKL